MEENDSKAPDSSEIPDIKQTLKPTLPKVPGVLTNSGSLGNVRFDKHRIKLKVNLYHNGEKYDLTPYLLQVKTSTSLSSPSGKFTLLLSFQKRWDKLIFAMDYVEISFSRYLDDPPIIMRAFVSNVRRTRMTDSTGKVHRAITVNGENFGKIWSNYYIEYLVQEIGQSLVGSDIALGLANPLFMAYMLSENYGIAKAIPNAGSIPNKDLIQGLIDNMLNPYIEVLQQVSSQIPKLKSWINVLDDFQIVNGPLIQSVHDQSVYDVMNQFGNRPWCEYFIDDFADGPVLIYRNAPFKSYDGDVIWKESDPTSKYYAHLRIDDTMIIEEDVGTSDSEVYSYFFTYPAIAMYAQTDPRAMILGTQAITAEQESDITNIYNPHVDLPNLYRFGFKGLMIASNSIPLESAEMSQTQIQLAQKMNTWLVNAFRWTHKMKNGTIRMKGNEHMKIGRYVTQSSTKEQYYVESVDHEISLSQVGSMGGDNVYSFMTTVGLTRGRDISDEEYQAEVKAYGSYFGWTSS